MNCLEENCQTSCLGGFLHCKKHETHNLSECCKCKKKSYLNSTGYCEYHWKELAGLEVLKVKERKILDFIKFNILKKYFNISTIEENYKIKSYRVDLFFKFLEFSYIIEIDENSHKSYDKEKEKIRIKTIKNQFEKIIIIRINPDSYTFGPCMWKKKKEIQITGHKPVIQIIPNKQEIEKRFQIINQFITNLLISDKYFKYRLYHLFY